MTDTLTTATAVFRGPRERRRIEGKPDSPMAGFWFDVDAAALTNGVVECLRRNTYWHDLLDLMAPHVIAWNYEAELVEGSEEPAVIDPETGNEITPARTVYRVVGAEPIPPPAEGGVASLKRVWEIERARGVSADDGTLGWMVARLRGYREELPDDVKKLLQRLATSGTGSSDETPPTAPGAPSPTSRRSSSRATSPSPSNSTSPTSDQPSG